ncbi:hypothetical protein [Streptomyces sp. NPDC051211]|uniref:hypothetical protein n=1 Tax=Streptomyces sp. NPDC051211 TaxID=3154643 RepID=UPI00344E8452
MITWPLLFLVRVFGQLPVGKGAARLLEAATVPFDAISYLEPCGAVKVCGPRRGRASSSTV